MDYHVARLLYITNLVGQSAEGCTIADVRKASGDTVKQCNEYLNVLMQVGSISRRKQSRVRGGGMHSGGLRYFKA